MVAKQTDSTTRGGNSLNTLNRGVGRACSFFRPFTAERKESPSAADNPRGPDVMGASANANIFSCFLAQDFGLRVQPRLSP